MISTKNLLEISETLKNKIWNETKKMWRVAGPSILMRFSTFGVSVISQAFVGHIGPTELAAYALVFTVILRFANSILLGMNTIVDRFNHHHNHTLPAIRLRLPDSKSSRPGRAHRRRGGKHCALVHPGYILLRRVLQLPDVPAGGQSKNHVISYMAVYSLLQHVFGSWLLTVRYAFGVPGAMVSTILAYWIPSFGQLVYVMFGGCPDTWTGFTTFAFKDLGPMIKLSLSSGGHDLPQHKWLGRDDIYRFHEWSKGAFGLLFHEERGRGRGGR
ncbi:protein transparent testa 12 [Phtheirospermum japonicum]|uniref:Protein transparent testa 12 n=1 Tax=Phtheirospermum japonicum TaxID=374723 RepID=A0A830DIZ6_9LAMI|nr:protein transparent testa 12 [Phtheirospermum japonicum]